MPASAESCAVAAAGEPPHAAARNAPIAMGAFQAAYFLRQQPWFDSLTTQEQLLALRHASTARVRRGHIALGAGERPRGWHGVISGSIALEFGGRRERGTGLAALGPGDWCDEAELLNDAARACQAVAYSDAELVCLDRECFDALMASSMPFQAAVTARLAMRVVDTALLLEAERTCSLEQRLALYLSRAFCGSWRRIDVTQEEIGRLAGMSRQAANRSLRELHERGLVRLRAGRLQAVDHPALEGFLARALGRGAEAARREQA